MITTILWKHELLAAVNGTVVGNTDASGVFLNVETDSRNIKNSTLCMFVPLVGEFQDGHKYIPSVLEKGVSVVLLNNSEYEKQPALYEDMAEKNPYILFVKVENTLHALQNVAEAHVAKWNPQMKKISITGSCGKTTTKEMLVSVCKAAFGESEVAYTKGNLNSETGLPLSVLKCKGIEKVGIFEMGMNRENEIGEISKVFKSNYGIITNIGTAHIGLLGSRQNIASEKRKSLDYISETGAAFVPASDDFADFCTEKVKGKVVKFGAEISPEESRVSFIRDNGLCGTTFTLDGLEINLPISGLYNYQNALGVIACALEIGVTPEQIKQGLENLGSVQGRMEVRKITVNNKSVTLVNDCYNANPDSMKKSIELCCSLENVAKKIFVLGDMKELGDTAAKEHEAIGELLNKKKNCKVYFVGCDMKFAYDKITDKTDCKWFAVNSEEAFAEIAADIKETSSENDVILFKGSHSINLEKIIKEISEGAVK